MFNRKTLFFYGVCLIAGMVVGRFIFVYRTSAAKSDVKAQMNAQPHVSFKSWYKGDSGAVADLNGLSDKELVDLVGPPKIAEVINVKNGLLEYQIELHNLFPVGTDVELRELFFIQNFEDITLNLYVWLKEKEGKFKVVNSLLHDDNEEF